MIFLAAGVFAISLWLLPWWFLWLSAVILGYWFPGGWRRGLVVGVIGAMVNVALVFVQDGFSHGLISQRMNGLLAHSFNFHGFSPGIFTLQGLIAFLLIVVGYSLGKSAQLSK